MADDTGDEVQQGPPAWIDAAFIQEALNNGRAEVDHAIVDSIQVRGALQPGDNYCSVIYRVSAQVSTGDGQKREESVLVKTLPAGGQWKQMVTEQRFFLKEALVFAEILPAMHALLADAAPNREFPALAARLLRHGEGYLALEDLRPHGFRMGDRHQGLDLPHSLLTMRALGRFHAASHALLRRRPAPFATLASPFDEEGFEKGADNLCSSLAKAAGIIAGWTDLAPGFDQKILAIKDVIFEKTQALNRERPGRFNVLIHGDCWINNLLYRYEGDAVSDVRFLDFQISHVGNPAIDLIIIKFTSLQDDVYDNHWEDILLAYYDSLAETLKILGEDIPSLQDIRQELDEAKAYSIAVSFLWMPIIKLDTGVYDVQKEMEGGGEDWSGDNYYSAPFRHWMTKFLPELDRWGVFDELIK